MAGRYPAAVMVAGLVLGGLMFVGSPSSRADTGGVCGPTTLADLFPATTTTVATSTSTESDQEPLSTPVDATAQLAENEATPTRTCRPFVYSMQWPIAGPAQFFSSFGAPRDGGSRRHQGVDLAATTLTPVVAVADGTVSILGGDADGQGCCWMAIRHDDGWQSWYVHLNNDSYLTDDGNGIGIRPDLNIGSIVKAGEVIGWIGDSGNAEETPPHLHFELRTKSGVAIDPYPSLISARATSSYPALDSGIGPYLDDQGTNWEWVAAGLVPRGVVWTCDETGTQFCPNALADAESITNFASLLLGVEIPQVDVRTAPAEPGVEVETANINLVSEEQWCRLGVCEITGVTAAELSRLVGWHIRYLEGPHNPLAATALEWPAPALPSVEETLLLLHEHSPLQSCHLPLDDTDLLTRQEAMYQLMWWTGSIRPEHCFDEVQLPTD